MHHKLQKKRNKEEKSNIHSSILGHIPRIIPVISVIFLGHNKLQKENCLEWHNDKFKDEE
jgi:hypothetical protein